MGKFTKKIKTLGKTCLCTFAMMACFAMPQAAFADDISIYIDGELLVTEVAPTIIDGRTLLPLRSCGDALGAYVEYHEEDHSIDMIKDDIHITLQIGLDTATINDEETTLDVPPMIISDSTLVPLRFISQAFDCDVVWDATTLTIDITTSEAAAEEVVLADIPDSSVLEASLFNSINYIRSGKDLPNLVLSDRLNTMADNHSLDMSNNGYFSSVSPNFGTVTDRALRQNLPATGECLGLVIYPDEDINTLITDWFNDTTTRGILLHPSASYIGISTYSASNSNKVYAVIEVLNSAAYFTTPTMNSVLDDGDFTVTGKTLNSTQNVIAYKLNDDGVTYAEKKTFVATVSGDVFTAAISLWGSGEYLLQVDNTTMNISY